ncbi:MAG: hypothetical protein ABSF49_20045, partial [Roseiarcus sp.]|uniref:hypothetical protein n=1 Tax=Roseiarcus sp. TaxID=1969460 RepID=UPI003C1E238D
ENAAARMVRGKDPIRHHVRRQVRQSVMVNPGPAHKIPDSPGRLANSPISRPSVGVKLFAVAAAPIRHTPSHWPHESMNFRSFEPVNGALRAPPPAAEGH